VKARREFSEAETGQSLVEFAAFLTVLLIVAAGVLDLGRAYFSLVAIEHAAGEGVLFASYHPAWVRASDVPTDTADIIPEIDNITYRALHESPSGLVDLTGAAVGVAAPTIDVGEPITVTVTYSYSLMTPFINVIVGDGILPLQASAVQMIVHLDE
jgi:Flp pilus assembly protein TadG